ncbi:glycosyltransferase [uncultured Rhodoblastus sp.]|uniref:glycosyltransferase family 2 protein n=1 Tax=uncultured Rhodoblastus sp. TaxID=543037 RepID=UPI0025FA8D50|nr:glycosyltransferase [uncultured Rhodoblastus sp.]
MTLVSAKPRICACICTYQRYDLLPRAVESLARQTLTKDRYEILIVDNSPDFAKAEAFGQAFETFENLRYVVERTPGLSNARNVAAGLSKAPVIAFIDDDAVAAPNWAEEILRAFEIFGPATMIVGGRVDPIWQAPRPAWLHDSMLGNLSVVDWGGEARIAAPEEWVAGTNIALRVEAILQNGGFSRNLGRIGSGSSLLSNEEVQLVETIRAAGGKLVYAPDARVNHLVDRRRLTKTWFRKRAAWQAFSDFMMDPDRRTAEASRQWPDLVRYFNAMPPHERTIRGLLFETDDPDLFRWQTGAVYMLTTLALAGFEGVELA